MLIPMAIFILPVMFVLILGPAFMGPQLPLRGSAPLARGCRRPREAFRRDRGPRSACHAVPVFAWANFSHWRETGAPSGLGTTLLEGFAAVLFLIRRSPQEVSSRLVAWVAAPVGSFAMLLARPADGGLPALPCELLQLCGLLFALASLATLGRSFGIVAANRGVKTLGAVPLRAPSRVPRLLHHVPCLRGGESVAAQPRPALP